MPPCFHRDQGEALDANLTYRAPGPEDQTALDTRTAQAQEKERPGRRAPDTRAVEPSRCAAARRYTPLHAARAGTSCAAELRGSLTGVFSAPASPASSHADSRHLLAGYRRLRAPTHALSVGSRTSLYFNEPVYYFNIPVAEFYVKRQIISSVLPEVHQDLLHSHQVLLRSHQFLLQLHHGFANYSSAKIPAASAPTVDPSSSIVVDSTSSPILVDSISCNASAPASVVTVTDSDALAPATTVLHTIASSDDNKAEDDIDDGESDTLEHAGQIDPSSDELEILEAKSIAAAAAATAADARLRLLRARRTSAQVSQASASQIDPLCHRPGYLPPLAP